jgi:hypothetical protein
MNDLTTQSQETYAKNACLDLVEPRGIEPLTS